MKYYIAFFILFNLSNQKKSLLKELNQVNPFVSLYQGDKYSTREFCSNQINGVCQDCYESFLEQGQCIIPTNKVDHCLKYKKNGVCSECQLNYGLNNGKCEKVKIPDCLRTVNNDINTCQVCKDGIVSLNGKCENKTEKCTIDDCELCEIIGDQEFCTFCNNGFYLFMENLPQEDPLFICMEDDYGMNNCLYSTEIGSCSQCKLNFYMNEQGKCIKSKSYEENLYGSFTSLVFASVSIFSIFFQLINILNYSKINYDFNLRIFIQKFRNLQ